MATCPKGHENPESQHFCGECGTPLVARPVGTPPTPPGHPTGHPSGKREHSQSSLHGDDNTSAAEARALAAEAEAEAAKAQAQAAAAHAHVEEARAATAHAHVEEARAAAAHAHEKEARAAAAHAHEEAIRHRTPDHPLAQRGRSGGMSQVSDSLSGGYAAAAPTGFTNAAPFYLPNLIAGMAASVGVIVGSIGPWASVLAFTKNAMGGDGTITLILGIACGIALFTVLNLGRTSDGLRWAAPIAGVVSVAGLACLVVAIIDIVHILSAPTTDIFGVTIGVQVEWGLWMVAISSAALFVTAWVIAVQVRKALRTT